MHVYKFVSIYVWRERAQLKDQVYELTNCWLLWVQRLRTPTICSLQIWIPGKPVYSPSLKNNLLLFICFCQVSVVAGRAFDFLAACGLFILFFFQLAQHVGSRSLIRNWIPGFGSATDSQSLDHQEVPPMCSSSSSLKA